MTLTFSQRSLNYQLRELMALAARIETDWRDEALTTNLLADLASLSAQVHYDHADFTTFQRHIAGFRYEQGERHFTSILVPLERSVGRTAADHDFLSAASCDPTERTRSFPLYLVLENVRSAFNVGALFRTAECLGVQEILCTGYTPHPNGDLPFKTAMGTDTLVPFRAIKNTAEALHKLKAEGVTLVAGETAPAAPAHTDFCFPSPVAIVLGNERHGLTSETLTMVDQVVRIPMYGRKNSLNIGVAWGILGFEIIRQWEAKD